MKCNPESDSGSSSSSPFGSGTGSENQTWVGFSLYSLEPAVLSSNSPPNLAHHPFLATGLWIQRQRSLSLHWKVFVMLCFVLCCVVLCWGVCFVLFCLHWSLFACCYQVGEFLLLWWMRLNEWMNVVVSEGVREVGREGVRTLFLWSNYSGFVGEWMCEWFSICSDLTPLTSCFCFCFPSKKCLLFPVRSNILD
jgi:hypothetical protein